ncbi:MAG: hypothetical protein L0Y71_01220 [Gemmataceae bacterium]|nr:hypothetical protein [Gemmataceae bacterium]
MKDNGKPTITELMRDNEGIAKAIRAGVQQALRVHKLLGQPIAAGRNGKVVVIPPEEIELDEDTNGPPKLPDHMIP